jgi:hypothetical protein
MQKVVTMLVKEVLTKLPKKHNEEAAGVGIITKQNTTADVKPNSIKKNLKAFKLA